MGTRVPAPRPPTPLGAPSGIRPLAERGWCKAAAATSFPPPGPGSPTERCPPWPIVAPARCRRYGLGAGPERGSGSPSKFEGLSACNSSPSQDAPTCLFGPQVWPRWPPSPPCPFRAAEEGRRLAARAGRRNKSSGHQARRPSQSVRAGPLVIGCKCDPWNWQSRLPHTSGVAFSRFYRHSIVFGTWGHFTLSLALHPPVFSVGSGSCSLSLVKKMQSFYLRESTGICLLPLASLLLWLGVLLMNGEGGWRIVTFPVVDFQESPRLPSSLHSFISFQTDCIGTLQLKSLRFFGA